MADWDSVLKRLEENMSIIEQKLSTNQYSIQNGSTYKILGNEFPLL